MQEKTQLKMKQGASIAITTRWHF